VKVQRIRHQARPNAEGCRKWNRVAALTAARRDNQTGLRTQRFAVNVKSQANGEGKTMRIVVRTACLGLVLAATTLRTGCVAPVLAATTLRVSAGVPQGSEEVRQVFEHVIPNIDGKSMVAVVVTNPPAANRRPITTQRRHSSTPTCCQAAFAVKSTTALLTSMRPAKAFMRCRARITGSDKMRATKVRGACWLSLASIRQTRP
jgi:hypothetical protein